MSKEDIDYKTLEGLASIQCTLEEIAAVLHMSEHKVKQLMSSDPEFRRIVEVGQNLGKASLRRLQLRHAKQYGPAGVAMTIHLSKFWLGESETKLMKIEHNINMNNSDKPPSYQLMDGVDPSLLTEREIVELNLLCDMLDHLGAIHRMPTAKRVRLMELADKGMPVIVDVDDAPQTSSEMLALPAPVGEQTVNEEANADHDD